METRSPLLLPVPCSDPPACGPVKYSLYPATPGLFNQSCCSPSPTEAKSVRSVQLCLCLCLSTLLPSPHAPSPPPLSPPLSPLRPPLPPLLPRLSPPPLGVMSPGRP
ncbi:unnamed protein product [Closterium sp. NIES-54]